MVFNKIDAYTYQPKDEDDLTARTKENMTLEELESTWMSKLRENCIFVSAKNKINIDNLKDLLYSKVKEIHTKRFPYNDFLFEYYDDEQQ